MSDIKDEISEPKNIVTEFIKKKLDGNLDTLPNYDFWTNLKYDKKSDDYRFSKMTSLKKKDEGDPDDYYIVRAIMYLIWKDTLPELNFNDIGTGKKYRGDTLNSFRTLFGRDASVQEKYGFDESLSEKVNIFRGKYLTIGNFILLPNKSVKISDTTTTTLNTWRGSASGPGWFDYFDQFLMELNKCFNGERDQNDVLRQLLQENDFYFRSFKKDKMQDFVQLNYLEAYLYVNKIVHRFPDKLYHWWRKSPSEEECRSYRNFSELYIDESIRIIQIRGKMMLAELKKALKIH